MTRASLGGISPCFIVSDVNRTIDFYRDTLGFEMRYRAPDDETAFFGIVGRDAAQLFAKSDENVTPVPNFERHPYMRWDAYVYVADPDALAVEFAASGAILSVPLKDTEDGLRGFEVRDPDGYVLFFGRPR